MKRTSLLTAAGIALALALAACDSRQDGETVGQKVDQAVASAKGAAAEAKQEAHEAAQVGREKTEQAADKVGDVAITAAVNAGLAKDPDLSPLRINVDTKDGRVSLYGSAPSEAARQRAEQIAMAEKGVTRVDNKLAVETR